MNALAKRGRMQASRRSHSGCCRRRWSRRLGFMIGDRTEAARRKRRWRRFLLGMTVTRKRIQASTSVVTYRSRRRQETWGNMLRRHGPPSNALIVRPDNRGIGEISPARTLEAVTQALTVREKALSQLRLPQETVFLPMEGQVPAQKALKELWSHAVRLSYDAGHAFTHRKGVRQLDGPRDMVGLALRSWCERKAVQYS